MDLKALEVSLTLADVFVKLPEVTSAVCDYYVADYC